MDSINITNININMAPQPMGAPNLGGGYCPCDSMAMQRLQAPMGFDSAFDSTSFGPTGFAPTTFAPASFAPINNFAPALGGGQDPTQTMADMTLKLVKMLLKLMKNKPAKKKKKGGKAGHGGHKAHGGGGGSKSKKPGAASDSGSATSSGGTIAPGSADAQAVDKYLSQKGSDAGKAKFGELAEKYGKQYDVDPLILLAIAGHETAFGTTGVGLNGLLGVGAYDSDPNNSTRNSKFSGVEQQLKVGAETFANLRKKGGSNSSDPINQQTAAVNKAGWASDPNWHTGVDQMYNQVKGALA